MEEHPGPREHEKKTKRSTNNSTSDQENSNSLVRCPRSMENKERSSNSSPNSVMRPKSGACSRREERQEVQLQTSISDSMHRLQNPRQGSITEQQSLPQRSQADLWYGEQKRWGNLLEAEVNREETRAKAGLGAGRPLNQTHPQAPSQERMCMGRLVPCVPATVTKNCPGTEA